ncbi:MAG: hypothetical protein JNK48_02895 [Bryobacterales bacterium]|nr:hypothetical protein [Bryobacterales bacterium]
MDGPTAGIASEARVATMRIAVYLAAMAMPVIAAFPLRVGSGESEVARYAEYGYNAAVLGSLTQLATFEEAAPGAVAKGSPLGKQIEEARRRFREQAAKAKALGIEAIASTDEIQLPTAVLEQLAGKVTLAGDARRVDFGKEAFWELYRAKYREVLRAFPEIRYVMVRTGENYSFLHDGYSGQILSEPGVERGQSAAFIGNMQRLIEETRRVVVDEFGRQLIWRTWDLGNNGFHGDVRVYDKVLAGVKERRGLIFSIKFTQTDYWRYNDFNAAIGRGGVDQIVEFQAAREYEGKGAFPNYVGEEHAAAMRRCRDLKVKGVWIWNFGGGWEGPHLKSDRWVRANIYATARLAQNPDADPRELAREWAAKEFGDAAAETVAEMLLLSDDAVLGFRYIAPYSRKHKGWLPARNIMRDDIIRGERVLGNEGGLRLLYEGSKEALEEALEEKRKALDTVRRMRLLLSKARGVTEDALQTLEYMESITAVMAHYIRGMFLYYRWQETGGEEVRVRALSELREWRKAWHEHRTEIPKLAGAATPYRSQNNYRGTANTTDAMEETCERALLRLEVSRR